MGLYQYLHSRLHQPTRPLRSIYRCGETENLLAWVSIVLYQSIDLHCYTSHLIDTIL